MSVTALVFQNETVTFSRLDWKRVRVRKPPTCHSDLSVPTGRRPKTKRDSCYGLEGLDAYQLA
jgi:hypothetical protein